MQRGSLPAFNPRNTGLYEARLWQAYYDHNWPLALMLLYRLMRSQFGLAGTQALQATCWGVLAAMTWVPAHHDRARVGRLITRFYRVVRAATGADFDPEAAGAAELHYWAVHRELAGQRGRPELLAALVGVTTTVCGLGQEQVLPSARARAHACELVDAITAGKQAPTPHAWAAIAASLRRSHQLLGEALRAEQRAPAE
jgi:hypothetical protein